MLLAHNLDGHRNERHFGLGMENHTIRIGTKVSLPMRGDGRDQGHSAGRVMARKTVH